MIATVQIVYSFLKEVVSALLFGYSEGNKEIQSSENLVDGECMVQMNDSQGE